MKYLFLDTNIYLHYQDFQQIPWNKVLGIDEDCTVVVVPKVHAELDEKKDSAKGKIQRRAKKISSKLYEILMKHETTKIPVVRCKAPNPTEEDKRMLDLSRSDNVIILSAIKSGWNNDDIVIISADKNIQFTAQDFGLGHYLMSDDYRLPPEQDEKDIEIQKLRHELEQLKARHSETLFYKTEVRDIKTCCSYGFVIEKMIPFKNDEQELSRRLDWDLKNRKEKFLREIYLSYAGSWKPELLKQLEDC